MNCSTPGLPVHHQLWSPPKPMSIELVIPSNHLILCRPLLLLPSIFPSTRVFSNESALCISWPNYGSFSFNISPSNEHPGLISFRMDWLDLFAVQGILKSLLQHHSSKTSILLHSSFSVVQLWHPYMTTGKTIALTRQTFVDKVMFLLFNMLSRLVITFLQGASILISWLQSPCLPLFTCIGFINSMHDNTGVGYLRKSACSLKYCIKFVKSSIHNYFESIRLGPNPYY